MKFLMGKFEKEIKEPLINSVKRNIKIIQNSFYGKNIGKTNSLLSSISDVKIIRKKE